MISSGTASPFEEERLQIAREAPGLSRAPAAPDIREEAARRFDQEEPAHLLWQIAAISAWNRIAVATRQTVGEYRPR